MGPSIDQNWVQPRMLANPEIATTVRLVPLTTAHAPDLHAIADPKLFTHTMQVPSEWSVRGFAAEVEKVLTIPMSVAFAIELVRDDRGFPAGRVIGVVEAQSEGHTLKGVETQSAEYIGWLPKDLPRLTPDGLPLPFTDESTGTFTQFTSNLDPEPRSREV